MAGLFPNTTLSFSLSTSSSQTQNSTATSNVTASPPLTSRRIPTEVIDLILYHVHAQSQSQHHQNPHYYSGKSTLLAFARVSKVFYERSVPWLYRDVKWNISKPERFVKFQRFCRAVQRGGAVLGRYSVEEEAGAEENGDTERETKERETELGAYVESLEIVNDQPSVYELHVPAFNAFRKMKNLRRVVFIVGQDDSTTASSSQDDSPPGKEGVVWKTDLSRTVQTNLSILFTLPSLTYLKLSGIHSLPFTLLTAFTAIPSLTLSHTDIDTTDETGVLRRTPLPTPESIRLSEIEIVGGVSSNLVRTLGSVLSVKPGVVRRLRLVSDVEDLEGVLGATEERLFAGQLRGKEDENEDSDSTSSVGGGKPSNLQISIPNADKKGSLGEWVLDLNGEGGGSGFGPDTPAVEKQMEWKVGKKGKRFKIPHLQVKTTKIVEPIQPMKYPAFSKAAWCLIEAAGTSLERLEWECSSVLPLSFKPINLHFLRYTLRFLTVTITYPSPSSRRKAQPVLTDILELAKQLSTPETVLEELVIKCICVDQDTAPPPVHPSMVESKTGLESCNSSMTTLVGSDKTVISSTSSNSMTELLRLPDRFTSNTPGHSPPPLPIQSAEYLKEWTALDTVLKGKKYFKKLVWVVVEFVAGGEGLGGGAGEGVDVPELQWWKNHARKVEKRLVGLKGRGAGVRCFVKCD
ncbi:hypothetical protein CC2G_006566 [Coprinopsis cinerea AmutBmut pab1-1]|nr:hypothetical protein CC2G_006566 [Coprinopsis cinerea AmutBmut pab1-1]